MMHTATSIKPKRRLLPMRRLLNGFLSQVAFAPVKLRELDQSYHKPEDVVHKPFKRDRTAKIYARSIRSPHFFLAGQLDSKWSSRHVHVRCPAVGWPLRV